MPSSVYLQTRHKQFRGGLLRASKAATCFNCGHLAPLSDLVKGWCLGCMQSWKATADHGMIAQVAKGYSPESVLRPITPAQMDGIKFAVAEPKRDEDYIDLVLFKGNASIGRMQAYWNFARSMERLEIASTADMLKLGIASHDTLHLCGMHAPVQRLGIQSFLSRLFTSDAFEPIKRDHHLREYLRGFSHDNKLHVFHLERISRSADRSHRSWRGKEKIVPLSAYWPFLHKHERSSDCEHLLAVDRLVPKGIPEQWRQDMCQDLVVALLTGDLTIDNLKDNVKKYISKVWRDHPIKYGPQSLDHKAPWAKDDDRTLGDFLSAPEPSECEDEHEDEDTPDPYVPGTRGDHGIERGRTHAGFNRPTGLSRMGDLLRHKHGGTAF